MVELFGALCAYHLKTKKNSNLEKRVSAIIKKLTEINELRNKVIHSQFLYIVEEKSFQRFKSSAKSIKGFKQEEVNFNSKDLFNLSNEIQRLISHLESFVEQEIVPIVLKPIWINKNDDIKAMWMGWRIMFSSSV